MEAVVNSKEEVRFHWTWHTDWRSVFYGLGSGTTNKTRINSSKQEDPGRGENEQKREAKKRIASHNKITRATGGGPATPALSDERTVSIFVHTAAGDGDVVGRQEMEREHGMLADSLNGFE